MKITKKIVSAAIPISFLLLLALPTFVASIGNTSVLESSKTSKIAIGDSFVIRARGITNSSSDYSDTHTRTRMRITIQTVRIDQRGIRLNVTGGQFYLGHTKYNVADGFGIVGCLKESRFNNTIVFGFRLNMTGPDGELAELFFKGILLPSKKQMHIVAIRGILSLESLDIGLAQRGVIHKIDT